MRAVTLALVGLALLTAASGAAVATENTPPLASAGLDQAVPPDSTVYLDASGSADPDGEITSYQWLIETPSGTTRRPACGTCRQTEFDVDTVGQYAVTLTVTDDDGASRSDTLYVNVRTDGPAVSLSGPTSTAPDSQAVFTATASAENASLRTLVWVVDGDVLERESLSGSDATRSLTRSFNTTDEVPVSAVAYDTLGRRGTATQSLTVRETAGGLGTGNGCNNGNAWEGLCTGGGDALISVDGNQYILDSNGEEGIQLPADNGDGLRTYDNPTSSQSIRQREAGGGLYVIDQGVSVGDALDQTVSSQQESAESVSNRNENQNSGITSIGQTNNNHETDAIADTTEEVLEDIGIAGPQPASTDSGDDDSDSSDSSSDDTTDSNDESGRGSDEGSNSDSDKNDTNDNGGSKTRTGKADNSDSKSGSKGSGGGFGSL
jgi:hypothetical protein